MHISAGGVDVSLDVGGVVAPYVGNLDVWSLNNNNAHEVHGTAVFLSCSGQTLVCGRQDDMIKSVSMHTKLPRKRVLAWFQKKRQGAMADKYGPRPEDLADAEKKGKRRWY